MQDFVINVSRYPRYLISLSLGIFWFFLQQFKPFFKNPVTAIAIVGFFVGGFSLLYLTLEAMLGIS